MSKQLISSSIQLPSGEMVREVDGGLAVYVNGDQHTLNKIISTFQPLKRLDARYFLDVYLETSEEENGKLCLLYPTVNSNMHLFADIAKNWRQNPQIRVPLYINLVYFLVESLEQLKRLDISLMPPSPVTLFYTPELSGNWRLLPVPLFISGLGNWASADSQTWQWVSSTVLFGKEIIDERFLIGAALYYCLVGDLFPALLSDREKFQRLLTGRIGVHSTVSRAVRSLLPNSLGVEGEQLAKVILNLISPNSSVQMNNNEPPKKYIEEIARELSPHRLALRWEYEGRFGVALELLSVYSNLVSPKAVPWETIARLKEKQQDWKGGFEARLNALKFGQTDAVRNAIIYLRWMIQSQPEPANNPDVRDLLENINQALPQTQPGLYDLQLAHLELRYLDQPDKALQRITRNYREPWHRLLQLLIRVRVYCSQNQYPTVSNLCKQGVKISNQMPDREGHSSRYAMSFLLMMDGIAHFGATGQLKDVSYLIDAFSRFTQALDLAIEVQADDLINIGVYWLVLLQGYAVHFPPQIQQTLITGIDAYLYAKKLAGLNIPDDIEDIPSIPWYSENLFFPQN